MRTIERINARNRYKVFRRAGSYVIYGFNYDTRIWSRIRGRGVELRFKTSDKAWEYVSQLKAIAEAEIVMTAKKEVRI